MDSSSSEKHNYFIGGRKKKLLAGVGFSCLISGEKNSYNCSQCDEKHRERFNCHNRRGYKKTLLQGVKEWQSVSESIRPVLKMDDIKFYECPVSAITNRTWQILRLVNDCTGSENCEILHLPFPGTILDQPPWFMEAVAIVRQARSEHRRKILEEQRKNNGR